MRLRVCVSVHVCVLVKGGGGGGGGGRASARVRVRAPERLTRRAEVQMHACRVTTAKPQQGRLHR